MHVRARLVVNLHLLFWEMALGYWTRTFFIVVTSSDTESDDRPFLGSSVRGSVTNL